MMSKFWNSPLSMVVLVPTIFGLALWELATGKRLT